jgi:hypothetical protein
MITARYKSCPLFKKKKEILPEEQSWKILQETVYPFFQMSITTGGVFTMKRSMSVSKQSAGSDGQGRGDESDTGK